MPHDTARGRESRRVFAAAAGVRVDGVRVSCALLVRPLPNFSSPTLGSLRPCNLRVTGQRVSRSVPSLSMPTTGTVSASAAGCRPSIHERIASRRSATRSRDRRCNAQSWESTAPQTARQSCDGQPSEMKCVTRHATRKASLAARPLKRERGTSCRVFNPSNVTARAKQGM